MFSVRTLILKLLSLNFTLLELVQLELALIVIGLFIGRAKIGKLTEWLPVLLFSILTLAILPAVFYYGAKFFGFIPSQFSNSIIQAAMPLAITPFALADKYNLNKDFIARSIVLSTILAVVSLPFWISILTS